MPSYGGYGGNRSTSGSASYGSTQRPGGSGVPNVNALLGALGGGGRTGAVRTPGFAPMRGTGGRPVIGSGLGPGGGGGAVQGGGGTPPPGSGGASGSYNAQQNPLYQQMMDILRQQMAQAQGLYDRAPDFSGQRANINKMQSIANRERMQMAGARGGASMGAGMTTAQLQQQGMADNQAMTGAAREWGNQALTHQENVLNSMNQIANIMAGNTNASAGNQMAQLAEQRAQNALAAEIWRQQEALRLESTKVAQSGQLDLLRTLSPYLFQAQGGRANPLSLI